MLFTRMDNTRNRKRFGRKMKFNLGEVEFEIVVMRWGYLVDIKYVSLKIRREFRVKIQIKSHPGETSHGNG